MRRQSSRRSAALLLALTLGAAGTLAVDAAEAATQRVVRPIIRPSNRQSDDAYNRDVRIHNQTGWTMVYLYAAPGGTQAWNEDFLGSSTLAPGDSLVMTIDDGSGACRYDLRAEFDNGQALQRNGINVCQVADYYFTR